jgi:hypothetical protein
VPVLVLALTLIALVLRLAVVWRTTGPVTISDEIHSLIEARWMAGGVGGELSGTTFKTGGYPLLLVPAAALTHSPKSFYLAAGVTNAVLGAALVPLLAALLRRFRVAPALAAVCAFVVSCYPSEILYARQALPEVVLPVLIVAWLLLIHGLITRPTPLRAVAVGLATTACYSAHGRMAPVLLVTPLVLLFSVVRGHLSWRPVAWAVAAQLASHIALAWLHRQLLAALWPDGPSGVESSVTDTLSSLRGVGLAAVQMAAAVWVLGVAPLGLFVLGLVLLARSTRDGTPAGHAAAVAAIASFAGIVALSAALSVAPDRADQFVYGRYVEPALALPFALGLAGLLRGRARIAMPGVIAATTLALTGALVQVVRGDGIAAAVENNASNVQGLAALVGGDLRPDVLRATALSLLGLATVLVLARWRPLAGRGRPVVVALLLAFFAVGVVLMTDRFYRPLTDRIYTGFTPPPDLDADEVAFDTSTGRVTFQYLLQFWVDDARFVLFDGRAEPTQRYVFSTPSWPGGQGAHVIWTTADGGLVLYDRSG